MIRTASVLAALCCFGVFSPPPTSSRAPRLTVHVSGAGKDSIADVIVLSTSGTVLANGVTTAARADSLRVHSPLVYQSNDSAASATFVSPRDGERLHAVVRVGGYVTAEGVGGRIVVAMTPRGAELHALSR